MDTLEYYSEYAHKKIAEGYASGGITALKEKYPQAYRTMEKKLEKNWNKKAIDTYCKDFINGLKAVGFWQSHRAK